MFEDLAIDFARWLDTDFRLWCNSKIKEFLNIKLGFYSKFLLIRQKQPKNGLSSIVELSKRKLLLWLNIKGRSKKEWKKEIAVNTLEEKKGDIEFF